MATRSPRVKDTYRAARRNGSGALPSHSPVMAEAVKHRPVPSRPWLPKAERIKLAAKKASNKPAMQVLQAMIREFKPSSKRGLARIGGGTELGTTPVKLSVWSGFKKRRQAARRGLDHASTGVAASFGDEPSHAEKMQHAWYRKEHARKLAAERAKGDVGRPVPPHGSGGSVNHVR